VTLISVPLLSARSLARAGRPGWALGAWLVAWLSAGWLVASTVGPAHGFLQRAGLALGDLWVVARAVDLCFLSMPTTREPTP
jgi:hypothetical protein